MASPIPLELPRTDPRIALQARLQNAPAAHAEALLAAYEVLQGLHDRGVLDLMRSALGSGDEVLEIAVAAANRRDRSAAFVIFSFSSTCSARLTPTCSRHLRKEFRRHSG